MYIRLYICIHTPHRHTRHKHATVTHKSTMKHTYASTHRHTYIHTIGWKEKRGTHKMDVLTGEECTVCKWETGPHFAHMYCTYVRTYLLVGGLPVLVHSERAFFDGGHCTRGACFSGGPAIRLSRRREEGVKRCGVRVRKG